MSKDNLALQLHQQIDELAGNEELLIKTLDFINDNKKALHNSLAIEKKI